LSEEKSVKIPGPAYMIIGAGMVLMSAFINPEKLAFFVFIGALFIVIGVFKIIIKDKKPAVHHVAHHAPHHHQSAVHNQVAAHHVQHVHHAEHPSSVHHTQVARCSGCGVKLHSMFKFCPNCGQRLK